MINIDTRYFYHIGNIEGVGIYYNPIRKKVVAIHPKLPKDKMAQILETNSEKIQKMIGEFIETIKKTNEVLSVIDEIPYHGENEAADIEVFPKPDQGTLEEISETKPDVENLKKAAELIAEIWKLNKEINSYEAGLIETVKRFEYINVFHEAEAPIELKVQELRRGMKDVASGFELTPIIYIEPLKSKARIIYGFILQRDLAFGKSYKEQLRKLALAAQTIKDDEKFKEFLDSIEKDIKELLDVFIEKEVSRIEDEETRKQLEAAVREEAKTFVEKVKEKLYEIRNLPTHMQ